MKKLSTQAFKTITFKPNEILFREGEKADTAYIIKKGSVKISKKAPSGQSIPIAMAEKGGIVGEMAIVTDAPRCATVVAQEFVEAIAVSKKSFETRLEKVDPFLHSLIKTIITRLRKTSDHTVALFEKVKETKKRPATVQTKSKPSKTTFTDVNFMLADPNAQTRNSLRGGLFGFGFREICDVSSFSQISESIEKTSFDLLVLDTAFGISHVCELIHDIRHGIDCKNPFMSILVLTELKSKKTHQTLINAGCDQIIMKPISIQGVTEIINNMCTKERSFVVTRDYIGPDRPQFKEDQAEDAPHFKAPNTLGAKILHGAQTERIEHAIEKGIAQFNEIKMERHLVQLAWLLDRIDPKTGEPYDIQSMLDRIDTVLEDLSIRAFHSRYESSADICRNMRNLVSSLKEDEQSNSDNWRGMTSFYHDLLENIPLIETSSVGTQAQVNLMN